MLRIEPFAQAHLDEVVALCAAEGWPSWTRENAVRAFSAPGVLALVARAGNEVVGVAELSTNGRSHGIPRALGRVPRGPVVMASAAR